MYETVAQNPLNSAFNCYRCNLYGSYQTKASGSIFIFKLSSQIVQHHTQKIMIKTLYCRQQTLLGPSYENGVEMDNYLTE